MYYSRGNYSRAAKFIKYTKNLLEHIATNITNPEQKKIFLHQKDRKAALEMLANLEKNVN
jgi:hypothetical protein